jgi:hypothetical protein
MPADRAKRNHTSPTLSTIIPINIPDNSFINPHSFSILLFIRSSKFFRSESLEILSVTEYYCVNPRYHHIRKFFFRLDANNNITALGLILEPSTESLGSRETIPSATLTPTMPTPTPSPPTPSATSTSACFVDNYMCITSINLQLLTMTAPVGVPDS